MNDAPVRAPARRSCVLVATAGALLSACAHHTLVTSTPPGATVTIGDDVVGVTPIEVHPTRKPIRVETADAQTVFTMIELEPRAALRDVGLTAFACIGRVYFLPCTPTSRAMSRELPDAVPTKIHVDFTRGNVASTPPGRIAPVPSTSTSTSTSASSGWDER